VVEHALPGLVGDTPPVGDDARVTPEDLDELLSTVFEPGASVVLSGRLDPEVILVPIEVRIAGPGAGGERGCRMMLERLTPSAEME